MLLFKCIFSPFTWFLIGFETLTHCVDLSFGVYLCARVWIRTVSAALYLLLHAEFILHIEFSNYTIYRCRLLFYTFLFWVTNKLNVNSINMVSMLWCGCIRCACMCGLAKIQWRANFRRNLNESNIWPYILYKILLNVRQSHTIYNCAMLFYFHHVQCTAQCVISWNFIFCIIFNSNSSGVLVFTYEINHNHPQRICSNRKFILFS